MTRVINLPEGEAELLKVIHYGGDPWDREGYYAYIAFKGDVHCCYICPGEAGLLEYLDAD